MREPALFRLLSGMVLLFIGTGIAAGAIAHRYWELVKGTADA